MGDFVRILMIMLLIASVIGYILVVLKEKLYLKNNVIVIDNKYVTQEHIDNTDLKEFFLDGTMLNAGDEIRLITKKNERFDGILIGATKKEKSLLLVTHENKVLKLGIDNILQFRILSKYGKFFVK